MTTPYHARYFAYELTRRQPSGVERLSTSLFNASVDLNPHQIEAALFALQSPLSQGVILADEVGLGKTIEAGLVLCQFWAERRRRLLVVCPASLRKQWSLELEEKFNLPTFILDKAAYNQVQASGNPHPFESDRVVITSINFAAAFMAEVRTVQWDMVVIDEAHKLRNAYRPSNKMGQRLREALAERRKLLLTATPLQNSLLELYGLVSLIDERTFGEVGTFRAQYMRQGSDVNDLRQRLAPFTKRTLRNQVTEYIQYTSRRPITRPFRPTSDEHTLYETLSEFFQREDTYSIPTRQRALITLILRKLLASSSRAIAGTLETMRDRLQSLLDGTPLTDDLVERIIAGEDLEEEILEEDIWEETEGDDEVESTPPPIDRVKLKAEIDELNRYIQWARGIAVDTKSRILITALDAGFTRMAEMGAPRKALVFTESRRTQTYLKDFLEANGYAGKLVLFNGNNSDPEARVIYDRWRDLNEPLGRTSGSRLIDIRTALIEHFRDSAEIMIATEAAAEGVNLQFCSLVVNYDLPWNPQRIEQRIGRCHRYGQKHDVVVINFLNESNDADRRVLELLNEKFNLFNGVFGASDEVLGAIESGVDFEKRILAIYQQCRTPAEIESAFAQLRAEMDDLIRARMESTRQTLLEHFDEDVHARLRLQLDDARNQLDRVGQMFWVLTRFMLAKQAAFDDTALTFDLSLPPRPEIRVGRYHLISKMMSTVPSEFLYRLSHPLGEHVLGSAHGLSVPLAHLTFDLSHHATRISALEPLQGQSGWLTLQSFAIEAFEREEYALFSSFTDTGIALDQETCEKMFRCSGSSQLLTSIPSDVEARLVRESERYIQATLARSLESNNRAFQQEREKLDRWADDMIFTSEKALTDTKAQIKLLERQARLATTTDEQLTLQSKVAELERVKRHQRQQIFEVEDNIKAKRDTLIVALERRLSQRTERSTLFTLRWTIV